MSRWASGVTVVAVRHDRRVYATTVSSFASVSADPPLVVVSLGASAQVLPFLKKGARFTVSVLGESQRRLATVFADPYPVGPSPFPEKGPPVLERALASLVCSVRTVAPLEASALVVGLVVKARLGAEEGPLLYWRRGYRGVDVTS